MPEMHVGVRADIFLSAFLSTYQAKKKSSDNNQRNCALFIMQHEKENFKVRQR